MKSALSWLLKLLGPRVPAVFSLAMAAIMSAVWLQGGLVSPAAPQTIADHAYRELWSNPSEGSARAIGMFRQALAMDPAFPYRWSDLGEALAGAGQTDAADYCFRRSLELDPNSPQIAMRAANFQLREGKQKPALELGARVLRDTNAYDDMVFSSWTRLGGNTDEVLRQGVVDNGRAAESFFRFLLRSKDEAALNQAWPWMESRSFVTPSLAREWAGWLIGQHREAEAFGVWKRYVNPDYGVTNWIENPGFETMPTGMGFDWNLQDCAGARASLDPAVKRFGDSSLRLDFDGSTNVNFHHLTQPVLLPPGKYRLTAWVRTADLAPDPVFP